MPCYIHPDARVEAGALVGDGTRIWAFAHVLPGVTIGKDCNVCDHTFIENEVQIGDRVTLKCGVFLWTGITVGNDVFIGPNATFVNDARPRSRQWPQSYAKTVLEDGCSIGANATVLGGLTIGRFALVAAGAVVTKDVPPHGLVVGNPARLKGHVCRCGDSLAWVDHRAKCKCGDVYVLVNDEVIAQNGTK